MIRWIQVLTKILGLALSMVNLTSAQSWEGIGVFSDTSNENGFTGGLSKVVSQDGYLYLFGDAGYSSFNNEYGNLLRWSDDNAEIVSQEFEKYGYYREYLPIGHKQRFFTQIVDIIKFNDTLYAIARFPVHANPPRVDTLGLFKIFVDSVVLVKEFECIGSHTNMMFIFKDELHIAYQPRVSLKNSGWLEGRIFKLKDGILIDLNIEYDIRPDAIPYWYNVLFSDKAYFRHDLKYKDTVVGGPGFFDGSDFFSQQIPPFSEFSLWGFENLSEKLIVYGFNKTAIPKRSVLSYFLNNWIPEGNTNDVIVRSMIHFKNELIGIVNEGNIQSQLFVKRGLPDSWIKVNNERFTRLSFDSNRTEGVLTCMGIYKDYLVVGGIFDSVGNKAISACARLKLYNTSNRPPVAQNDSFSVLEDRVVEMVVIGNDVDPDGDHLFVNILKESRHGALRVNADESIQYQPEADFNGFDTVTYSVCDLGGLCDTALLIINVMPVNDCPVCMDDTVYIFYNPDTIDVMANDWDIDRNDVLSLYKVLKPPKHSMAIIYNGKIVISDPESEITLDSLEYIVMDEVGAMDTCNVNIYYKIPNSTIKNNHDNKFHVIPNPFQNFVTIEKEPTNSGEFTVTLTDINGQGILLDLIRLSADTINLNLGKLDDGYYILRIQDTAGVVFSCPIIKRNQ